MILVFLLYALFASVFIVAKIGLEYTQPLFFVGSRMLFAGILMLGYQFLFARSNFYFRKKDIALVIGLGVFNIYLTNAFEFWGLKYLTSFKTCFIYSLSPFVSALLSYFMFSEKMNIKKWAGLLIGFLGFVPILMAQTAAEKEHEAFSFISWAELSVMAAAVCGVFGWILLRKLVSERGYSPFMANGVSMLIGGSVALFHSSLVETWDPLPVTNGPIFVECALLLIAISNLICYNLYGYLLKKYTATFMSFAGFVTPLFAAIFGWLYLGEVVTQPFYISAVMVFIGLFTFHQEELKKSFQLNRSNN